MQKIVRASHSEFADRTITAFLANWNSYLDATESLCDEEAMILTSYFAWCRKRLSDLYNKARSKSTK